MRDEPGEPRPARRLAGDDALGERVGRGVQAHHEGLLGGDRLDQQRELTLPRSRSRCPARAAPDPVEERAQRQRGPGVRPAAAAIDLSIQPPVGDGADRQADAHRQPTADVETLLRQLEGDRADQRAGAEGPAPGRPTCRAICAPARATRRLSTSDDRRQRAPQTRAAILIGPYGISRRVEARSSGSSTSTSILPPHARQLQHPLDRRAAAHDGEVVAVAARELVLAQQLVQPAGTSMKVSPRRSSTRWRRPPACGSSSSMGGATGMRPSLCSSEAVARRGGGAENPPRSEKSSVAHWTSAVDGFILDCRRAGNPPIPALTPPAQRGQRWLEPSGCRSDVALSGGASRA